jgi:hypothetical protein
LSEDVVIPRKAPNYPPPCCFLIIYALRGARCIYAEIPTLGMLY